MTWNPPFGTLLHLSKPVHGTGKVFILDSGFCVLQSLIKLKKRGCFAHPLIKKQRYWLKHILGDEIIAHFTDKEIGDADTISRILDEVPFYIFGMKEPDYIMQIMTTYGTMKQLGDQNFDMSWSMEVAKSIHFDTQRLFIITTNTGM